MATINQQRAAKRVKEAIEKGEKIDGGDILENIGYSLAIAKNPKMVFESKGFQEALKELGFSIEAADLTVAKILRTGKEENQIRAAQEIYKRTAAYAPERSVSVTVSLDPKTQELAKNYEQKLKDVLAQPS